MALGDYEADDIEVWADNWEPVQIFLRLIGQWRFGPGGPVALDHMVLYRRLDRMQLEPERYDQLFDDVCLLADEAISTITQKDDDDPA